jgi:hypothetical protein
LIRAFRFVYPPNVANEPRAAAAMIAQTVGRVGSI